jgi:hypothetical protein
MGGASGRAALTMGVKIGCCARAVSGQGQVLGDKHSTQVVTMRIWAAEKSSVWCINKTTIRRAVLLKLINKSGWHSCPPIKRIEMRKFTEEITDGLDFLDHYAAAVGSSSL